MSGCCAKKKHRAEEEHKLLVNRLSRIEGQVRGLRKMLDEDAYCIDVITQTAAVQAALGAFSRELMEEHIRTCVAEGLRAGDDSVLEELVDILPKLIK